MYSCKLLVVTYIVLSMLLMGCGRSEPITMKITHVVKEGTKWGCIGEDYKTYLKSEDGKIDFLCGQWGKVGDTISGYWYSECMESMNNGFRRYK
jgi:hypothetical protein